MSYIMSCLGRFNRLPVWNVLVLDCGFARIAFRDSIREWVPGTQFNRIHRIRNKMIHPPGIHPFLTLHHPPTLESSNLPIKKSCSSKNYTQLDSLTLDLLHDIGMLHAGLVHCNKWKPVLVRLTQHHPYLRASNSYKLKYAPF